MTTARSGRGKKKPAYEEIIIESWDSFLSTVLSKRYRYWAFRGHSDARWSLPSTLARRFLNANIDPRAWASQELRNLHIFKRKAHLFLDHIPDERDSLNWLAMMQHHGAPTRLLDFTWSAYVAAFFALESADKDNYAAIWAVNHAALYKRLELRTGGRRKIIEPGKVRPRITGNYEKYFVLNKYSFVVWDSPFVMNQRLIAQSGSFLVPSTLAEPVEDILSGYPNPKDVLVKFILETGKFRETAMSELYNMNITYYTLFPGLDGLARSMGYELETSRFYNPRTMKRNPGWG